ncbi:hypothetical protein TCAP_05492 [Tolypocladium capitatum]|uniref:Uncharacterized protein n=1 Tax=Tolypocladium capitatum TaxID=45235 RepID=A0A2K3QAI8_9HYPO|nr:hypothetical protein TCAP_05492 [Tolypocladium capitatum]
MAPAVGACISLLLLASADFHLVMVRTDDIQAEGIQSARMRCRPKHPAFLLQPSQGSSALLVGSEKAGLNEAGVCWAVLHAARSTQGRSVHQPTVQSHSLPSADSP